jgi:hypothetical protein
MFKLTHFLLPVAILAFAITGCQQASAPAPTPGSGAAAGGQPGAVQATSNAALSITPATISTCDPGVEATVNWDAQAAHETTTSAEVWVGTSPADLKLFAAGASTGQAQTGPWTHPGSYFVLKNKVDGKVLAEAKVGGPVCP